MHHAVELHNVFVLQELVQRHLLPKRRQMPALGHAAFGDDFHRLLPLRRMVVGLVNLAVGTLADLYAQGAGADPRTGPRSGFQIHVGRGEVWANSVHDLPHDGLRPLLFLRPADHVLSHLLVLHGQLLPQLSELREPHPAHGEAHVDGGPELVGASGIPYEIIRAGGQRRGMEAHGALIGVVAGVARRLQYHDEDGQGLAERRP
mmetsp:Transcript_57491/g.166413  ORF Transcript_57491/g.166413 Transcript_57491/m.166413 type:complete len:204 (-) Transcript_57491:284-895(-)